MSCTELGAAHRNTLLRVAEASIRHGFTHALPLPVRAEDYPETLRQPRAAFEDPRFLPVRPEELGGLTLSISILSPAVALPAASEAELIAALRPGIDGVILREGARRSTFLPSVWEQLPEPHQFLAHLRMKAGLPPDYWSDTFRFERYTTESFSTRACP